METIDLDLTALLDECFREGLTQSEIMLKANCSRKWVFRYLKRLKKQGAFSWALVFGEAFHTMLAQYYGQDLARAKEDIISRVIEPEFVFEEDVILRPDQSEEHSYYRELLPMMFERYVNYWLDTDRKAVVEYIEEELEYEYQGIRLRGKLDLIFHPSKRDGLFILDHKTTSTIDESQVVGWTFRFQFMFYAWMYWKVTDEFPAGMYVNVIKKPQERQGKKEPVLDFINRIRINMIKDPADYFKRLRLPLTKEIIMRFEKETLDPLLLNFTILRDYPDLRYPLMMSPNTDHCQVYHRSCEFLELCQNKFEDFSGEYIQMKHKHAELQK